MAETLSNVKVGDGNIYLADVGTALPTVTGTLGGSITWGASWSLPGFLVKDIEINFGEEIKEFTARGYKSPLKATRTGIKVTGKFTMAESDINALSLILGESRLTEDGEIVDNSESSELDYKALAIELDTHVMHFKKVYIKADFSLKLTDGDYVSIPVDFVAYSLDTATATEKQYKISPRTASTP